MSQAVTLLRERLLRKAYRPEHRPAQCPADVYACEDAFIRLVESATLAPLADDTPSVEGTPLTNSTSPRSLEGTPPDGPLTPSDSTASSDTDNTSEGAPPTDRAAWHARCNAFSDRWEHVCHWVHPSRLADHLTEQYGATWYGEFPVRAPEARVKVRCEVRSQRFRCAECRVHCNSYAQYAIHTEGTRHRDRLARICEAATAAGDTYVSPGALPLDLNEPDGVQPQAYYKRDTTNTPQKTTETSHTPPATPSAKPSTPPAPRNPKPTYIPKPLLKAKPEKRLHSTASVTSSRPSRPSFATAYAAFLAMSTLSLATTGDDFVLESDLFSVDSGQRHREPHRPVSTVVATTPALTDAPNDDDDTEPHRKRIYTTLGGIYLQGDAEAIAERIDSDLSYNRAGVVRMCCNSAIHDVASALVKICGKHAPELLGGLVASVGAELADVLSGMLLARIVGGPALIVETEAMTVKEVLYHEEGNTKEGGAYAAALSLGMVLCGEGMLPAGVLTTMLRHYVENVTSAEMFPASAADTAVHAARRLASKFASKSIPSKGFVVPQETPQMPRRVHHLLSAFA